MKLEDLEKAHELKPDDVEVLRQLVTTCGQLDAGDKVAKYRESLKEQQH